MRRALLFSLLSLALAACAADRTAILVEVTSADLAVPDDVDGLRFEATSEYGARIDRSASIRGQWPHSLTIVPPESERMGRLTITVTAFHGADFVTRRVIETDFQPGSTRRVTVTLSADCRGITCPDGVDCRSGACVGGDPDAGVPDDAGPDAHVDDDAAVEDAGPDDAGSDIDATVDPDAGPPDAGPPDAGPPDSGPVDSGRPDAAPPDSGAAVPCTGAGCVGLIVISEAAPRGPGSASDEFVELYNRSAMPVDVGGVELRYYSSTGSESGRGTIMSGTIIAPHGYLLLTSAGYAGPTPTDGAITPWTTGLADSGGVAIRAGTTYVDVFAWGGTVTDEGNAFAMAMPSSGVGSFERKANAGSDATSMSSGADRLAGNAQDTNNNANDLVFRPARDPQSRASPPEP